MHTQWRARTLICLNFHGLTDTDPPPGPDAPYWLRTDAFEAILDLVREQGRETALITFDDGYGSDLRFALPSLLSRCLTATFFIPTDNIGSEGHITAEGIGLLHAAGMRIGSHGAAHVPWTSVASDDLSEQVGRSLRILSNIIDEPVREVAVPFGAYDRRVLAVLRSHPIDHVYTSDRGPAGFDQWIVARNTVRSDTRLELIRHRLNAGFSAPERWLMMLRRLRRTLAFSGG